ncbi:hypothetical protein BBI10_21110 [Pseudomonas graminis]|uniref:Uncharacterized protein n=1 Tax=Pseudomonas graminis TaxID=158627 RepID=A0A1C2DHC6_9PSED|nr:hypothetical protein BBI10_21110 [Pseudomonas graminis]
MAAFHLFSCTPKACVFYGQMRREVLRVAVDAGARSVSAAAVIQIALWTDPRPKTRMRSTSNFIE